MFRILFKEYFHEGSAPCQAIFTHNRIMLSDSILQYADGSLNPKPDSVYYMHKKFMLSEHGDFGGKCHAVLNICIIMTILFITNLVEVHADWLIFLNFEL